MKVNIQVIRMGGMAARLVALPPLFGIKPSLVGWVVEECRKFWSHQPYVYMQHGSSDRNPGLVCFILGGCT